MRIILFRDRSGAVRVALAVGLALLAVAVAVSLSRPRLVLAGTNSIAPTTTVATSRGGVGFCQGDETLPGRTSAIRLWMGASVGPAVSVAAQSESQVVTQGAREAGWSGTVLTIPVERVAGTVAGADVCITLGRAVGAVALAGSLTPDRAPGEAPYKMRIEYLRPGPSWWSSADSVVQHMAIGRLPSGTLIALLPLALMVIAGALTAVTAWRQLGGGAAAGVRGPALACACVAWLSAMSWSIVTPPFQAPDEPSHFAYTQELAETMSLPSTAGGFSPEEETALADLDHQSVRLDPAQGTIFSPAQQRRLEHDLARPLSRRGGGAGVAGTEPPLYYALQTLPYYIGSGGTLLDQLALMRLLSTLMAGVTALFAFLFVREALPADPWAWTVGGLGVALFPLLGFISGVLNPDSMLLAVSTAAFYCVARGFRRGLTRRLAIAIGILGAVGLLTKLNFVGLLPGLVVALAVLARRAARRGERSAYGSLALALAIGGSPAYIYAIVNVLSNRPALGVASGGIHLTSRHGSPLAEISYIWQLYLPRLPAMRDYFPGLLSSRGWFDRFVGLYGWLDTSFPDWVNNAALVPAGAIAVLCLRALVVGRAALRGRIGELFAYATMTGGLLMLIGADSYLEYPTHAGGYWEPRYLLPVTALFGAVLVLAARGAGRRLGPAAGTLIVLLILGHDIFSQLLTVARYYG
jgi:hypothetical protein